MVNYTYVRLNLHLRWSPREPVDIDGPSAGTDGTDVAVDRDGGVDVDGNDHGNGSVAGMTAGRVKPPVITSAKSYQLKKDGLCNDYLTFQLD